MEEFVSDRKDKDRMMAAYGPKLTRCAGYRIIVPGYVCLHCGSSSPQTECSAPGPSFDERHKAIIAKIEQVS